MIENIHRINEKKNIFSYVQEKNIKKDFSENIMETKPIKSKPKEKLIKDQTNKEILSNSIESQNFTQKKN